MKMRYRRGIGVAIAMGLVMCGGAAAAAAPAPQPVQWESGPPAPFGGTRFDGAVYQQKVYFLGFRLLDNTTDGSIWYYDIKTQEYVDTGTDMAVPVTNYKIRRLRDANGVGLYTFGGRTADGETSTTVQVYYPDTDTTMVIDSDPWPGMTPSACVSLPATGVVTVGNIAYVVGGMSFSTSIPACVDDNSAEVWSFDPKAPAGDKWTAEPSLGTARGYVSTVKVQGDRIFAIGGDVNSAGTLTASPVVESWTPGDASWDDAGAADLPVGCDETQPFAFDNGNLGGTVTLAGCGQWPNALPDVYQYDVAGDSWSLVGALNEARRNQAGANIGTRGSPELLVLGGYDSTGANVLSTSELGTLGSAVPTAPSIPGGSIPGFRPSLLDRTARIERTDRPEM